MCTDIQKVSGLFDEAGPYINIGAFPTVEKLEEHFVKIHGNPETIKFQYAMYVPNLSKQSFPNFCRPYSNVYTAGEDEEVTIIYKKNPTSCVDHNFTVMIIIDRNFLKHNDIIDDIKKQIWKNIAPKAFFHQNKRSNDKINCECNGPDHNNPLGATFHAGCHQGAGHASKCKFFRHTQESIQAVRFKLTEEEYNPQISQNNVILETVTNDIVDYIFTPVLSKWCPETAEKMQLHIKNAPQCQLGHQNDVPKTFTCFAYNSDFCSHMHKDSNDFVGGVTTLLSLEKEDNPPEQYHVLPNYVFLNAKNPGPGIAFFLGDKTILIEASALEAHGSTRVTSPNRHNPTHVSIVGFNAQVCDLPNHGLDLEREDEWYKKFKKDKTKKK